MGGWARARSPGRLCGAEQHKCSLDTSSKKVCEGAGIVSAARWRRVYSPEKILPEPKAKVYHNCNKCQQFPRCKQFPEQSCSFFYFPVRCSSKRCSYNFNE